jgi:hypothetical protein
VDLACVAFHLPNFTVVCSAVWFITVRNFYPVKMMQHSFRTLFNVETSVRHWSQLMSESEGCGRAFVADPGSINRMPHQLCICLFDAAGMDVQMLPKPPDQTLETSPKQDFRQSGEAD